MPTDNLIKAMDEIKTRMKYYQESGPSEGWPEFLAWCGQELEHIESKYADAIRDLQEVRIIVADALDEHQDTVFSHILNQINEQTQEHAC